MTHRTATRVGKFIVAANNSTTVHTTAGMLPIGSYGAWYSRCGRVVPGFIAADALSPEADEVGEHVCRHCQKIEDRFAARLGRRR